jgi:hypothetical protein
VFGTGKRRYSQNLIMAKLKAQGCLKV